MFKKKSLFGLVAAVAICVSVILSPVAASAASPGLSLSITPDKGTASLGENISYTYVISSTSNSTIEALALTDNRLGMITLPSTSIAPGENLTVSAVYTVALADFPGPLSGSATVAGVSGTDNYSASATSSVSLNALASSVEVSMAADRATASVNDNITYTYTVTNTGQVELSSLALTDSKLGAIGLSSTTLAPQANLIVTAVYTVVAADLPGPFVNTATVIGQNPSAQAVTATSAEVSVTLNPLTSSVEVSKTADRASASVGDNITYTYTITNTGQVELTSLTLSDSKFGAIALSPTTLAPQANLIVTAVHTVVAADLPGPFVNTATVIGQNPSVQAVTDTSEEVSVALNPMASSVEVRKAADRASASVGDNVTYTYTITNTGQVELNSLALTDSKLGAIALSSTALAPQASLTATAIYTVVAADLPGPLANTATVTGQNPSSETVTAASASVSITLSAGGDDEDNGDDDEDNGNDDDEGHNNNDDHGNGNSGHGDDEGMTKGEWHKANGVPGKGLDKAPGQQKQFNDNRAGGNHSQGNLQPVTQKLQLKANQDIKGNGNSQSNKNKDKSKKNGENGGDD